ncbi:unnamed protein product [Diamesa hyperborea]
MAILFKYSLLTLYSVISLMLFEKVFTKSKLVIDEEFHLQQGIHFCLGRFEIWDPKITTFPGLYLVSALFLYPSKMCNVFMLRFISLAASIVNVYLIQSIRATAMKVDTKKMNLNLALETLTIAILPPMYFFAHLYYTDIISITTILGVILFSQKKYHTFAAVCGCFSVLMRQTNIVWICMVLGSSIVDKMVTSVFPKENLTNISLQQLISTVKAHLKNPKLLFNQLLGILLEFYGYILIIINFIIFLVKNGSIVVGDKSAHEATLHLPQILYFTLFVLIFAPTMWIPRLFQIKQLVTNRKLMITCVVLLIVIGVIVKFNTLVHPYMLADNRHYTFYIWNRFYGKYQLARYIVIPVYIFGLITIWKAMEQNTIGFKVLFIISLFLSLSLQRLIEVRYFLIPFLFLRLNMKSCCRKLTLLELISYLVINGLIFYLFFTKEIRWKNYSEPQRIIW